ncbi:hypothetical protein JCM5353_002433 [Sporobolomyces roseus]
MTERSSFDLERSRLISEIAENLGKCVTSVNQLNRNIESVNSVGSGFDQVSGLWNQFSQVMQPSSSQKEEGFNEMPERVLEGHERLPSGVVPGGGDPILRASTTSTQG